MPILAATTKLLREWLCGSGGGGGGVSARWASPRLDFPQRLLPDFYRKDGVRRAHAVHALDTHAMYHISH